MSKGLKIAILCIIVALATILGYQHFQGEKLDNVKSSVSTQISSIERVNEVVFLSTGVEKIVSAKNSSSIFGNIVPFSEKTVLLIVRYHAKFGIKEPVSIKELGNKSYEVKVPQFKTIGIGLNKENAVEEYDKSGELLSFQTKEIDIGKLVSKELSSTEQENILKTNMSYIKDSARIYYESIFKAIDPENQVKVVFTE